MAPHPGVKSNVPAAEVQRPRFGRLGLVVVLCFALGLLWPLLAGMNFVQRPPGSTPLKPDELESPGNEAEPLPSPPGLPAAESDVTRAAARIVPALTGQETVRIEGSVVVSCHGDADEPASSCDEPSLKGVIEEPIAKLALCAAADGASGILSLGLDLDFARGHVARVKSGESTTLSKDKATALVTCAEDVVVGTPLDDVEHEHRRYWLYYRVRFLPPGTPVDPASIPAVEEVVSASGRGTIGWKTAVVREAPSRQAKVAGQLLYGTRVNVTGRVGEWYRIEHGGGSIGWVHRKAIGM